MEQRRLRLGDILDDYCPRERRVTNHAIVAMIEEDVKQTRCTTCDAEHAYKGGKVPRRRKKETPAALYKEVLAGMPENEAVPVLAVPNAATAGDVDAGAEPLANAVVDAPDTHDEAIEVSPANHELAPEEEPHVDALPQVDEGPVHRPLIRATLPRPEGQKDTRPLPEFTIRHAGGRGGNAQFRGARPARGHAGHSGNGNGNRMPAGRFPGSRPSGQGRGPGGGRSGQGRGSQGGGFRGRKRSR